MQQAMFVREKAGKNAKAELYVVLGHRMSYHLFLYDEETTTDGMCYLLDSGNEGRIHSSDLCI